MAKTAAEKMREYRNKNRDCAVFRDRQAAHSKDSRRRRNEKQTAKEKEKYREYERMRKQEQREKKRSLRIKMFVKPGKLYFGAL